MRLDRPFPAALVFLFSLMFSLGGCGGGGGGGEVVYGTAAAGSALPDATVTLKDATGAAVTDTTSADGSYSVPVGGMTPPFLIECDDGAGTVLFSIRPEGPGVANITPYTDLVISSFYEVHDITLDDAFFDAFQGPGLQGADPVPTDLDVEAIESLVGGMVALWIQQEGLDPATFDLITTPFDADGTGFDAVLDNTTIVGDDITITDGITTQNSTLTADTSGTIMVTTTTTSGAMTTSSSDSTVIPTSAMGQTDLAWATAAMEQFVATIDAAGANLASADILPFLDLGFLDDGRNRTIFAAEVATSTRAVNFAAVTLQSVFLVDDVNHVVDAEFGLTETAGGQTATESVRLVFKKVGNAYLLFGNQRVAEVDVQMEARTDSFPGSTTNVTSINVDVSAPTGTVNDSVTISGGPFSNTAVPKDAGTRTDVLMPTPTTTLDYVTDSFFANSGDVALPAAGTVFQVQLTPTGGSQVPYDVVGNGVTNEHISITSPTLHALANANLGGTLTVQWTLPTTYAVTRVQLGGHVSDASSNQLQIESVQPVLSPTATSGTLQFPTSWTDAGGTHTVVEATINVSTIGTNGERSIVIYIFQ